ncbi:MAG: hypothetical protein MR016_11035 [Agathobacter sp.]|nr:hypothetical protein [Agathobacter sp.]
MRNHKKAPASSAWTIGVCGTEHGIGTTHIALSLSNYLCSKLRRKTAYVERNGSGQILALAGSAQQPSFCYMDITCYPCLRREDLPRIMQSRFSYTVIDLGILTSESCWDFYRCDIKLVVASVSPWKAHLLKEMQETLLYNMNTSQDHMLLLGNLGIKETVKPFGQRNRLLALPVPYLPNPFRLTTADCTFFEEMLAKTGINIP